MSTLLYRPDMDQVRQRLTTWWHGGELGRPVMFAEFMVPVLTEMCGRVSYPIYHWDGPGAIPHHDRLLAIPGLKMLQWTPGAGTEPPGHRRWWLLYHKTIEAGKKVFIALQNLEELRQLKTEFGPRLQQFYLGFGASSLRQAEEALDLAQV